MLSNTFRETSTYSEIAKSINSPKAQRAVGSALGANPVPVLIPCHRVLRNDGSVGGYAYGSHIKELLLTKATLKFLTERLKQGFENV